MSLDAFLAYVDHIDTLTGWARHAELVEFARSKGFSAALLFVEGPVGKIAAEAHKALRADLATATPARAWNDAGVNARDWKAIYRHLRIDPSEPGALFATLPFRIIRESEDRAWIAGAVGIERIFDKPHPTRSPLQQWLHVDITDVILWNPRTNEVRIAGEAGPGLLTCADYENGRYTVFADGFSFFRAWADRRAESGERIKVARASSSRVVPREPIDSGLPGILAIGDLDRIAWRDIGATVLTAGPGVDAEKLKRAIFRAANLPRVEAGAELRAAA